MHKGKAGEKWWKRIGMQGVGERRERGQFQDD